mgnify:CR=1 FL=1
MARSLYSKFVLGYLIFGLLSVLTIATFSSGITRDYLIKDRANALYDEANDIAASAVLCIRASIRIWIFFPHN